MKQPQPTIRLPSVGLGSVSVFFPVHATGPLNTKLNTKIYWLFRKLIKKHIASMWWVVLEWHCQVLVSGIQQLGITQGVIRRWCSLFAGCDLCPQQVQRALKQNPSTLPSIRSTRRFWMLTSHVKRSQPNHQIVTKKVINRPKKENQNHSISLKAELTCHMKKWCRHIERDCLTNCKWGKRHQ
jgi:hypothetical protein